MNRLSASITHLTRWSTLLLVMAMCSTSLMAQGLLGKIAKPTASDSSITDTTRGSDTAQVDISAASPRASLDHFFTLAGDGKFDSAAVYLDVPDSLQSQAATLARRLKAVLDRYLWVDLSTISPNAVGDTADGLSRGVDQIGTIRNTYGINQPVRLVRWQNGTQLQWRFSRATVTRIPGWYDMLGNRWLLDRFPTVLLRTGPFDILWWQWLALPIVILIGIIIGYIISRIAQSIFGKVTTHTESAWDDAVIKKIGSPFTAFCTFLAIAALLPWLSLSEPATHTCYRFIRVGIFIVIFWTVWRLVDVVRQVLAHTRWARTSAASLSLLPLGARVAKVLILAVAIVNVFYLFGYPIASLIAGLGLGGLALALAAQKTVENLFGAFSIGVDQPFREGDFVKVQDFVGTVEAIGLRSTRFRTLDRTIITLPNGQLADMRLESFTARDRLRLYTAIGLVYETKPAQMRQIIEEFEKVLRDHPKIWPDSITVRFSGFTPSSLNIDVMAWFLTTDWGEFQLIRQNIFLQFMDIVERAGSSFAFPTSTIHLVHDDQPAPDAVVPSTPNDTPRLPAP
jgi:MscS family membrane protein